MTYLLDTNVISEPGKPHPSPKVLRWLADVPGHELAVSVMTIGELRKGAENLRSHDDGRADALDAWITETVAAFGDRVIAVSVAVAEAWGRLEAVRPRPRVDALIGATALVHGMTVATRNVRDFEPMGVATYNPFEDS